MLDVKHGYVTDITGHRYVVGKDSMALCTSEYYRTPKEIHYLFLASVNGDETATERCNSLSLLTIPPALSKVLFTGRGYIREGVRNVSI